MFCVLSCSTMGLQGSLPMLALLSSSLYGMMMQLYMTHWSLPRHEHSVSIIHNYFRSWYVAKVSFSVKQSLYLDICCSVKQSLHLDVLFTNSYAQFSWISVLITYRNSCKMLWKLLEANQEYPADVMLLLFYCLQVVSIKKCMKCMGFTWGFCHPYYLGYKSAVEYIHAVCAEYGLMSFLCHT